MPIDFGKLTDKIVKRVLENLQDSNPDVKEAGEQIGENLADGIEIGFEDAAKKITASSLKINKAFKDLAKKITDQKISIGGKNMAIDIDFSDIDINDKDFQKRIDEVFAKFKIDNNIEFDSKAMEKQFRNMLALHIKYATKLSNLQNQAVKLTSPSSIKVNLKEQLAVMDGLKEIQSAINNTLGTSASLPFVRLTDTKSLKDTLFMLEQIEKGEEKAGKQRDTNVEKIKKENKELKEQNKILEEQTSILGGAQGQAPKRPGGRKKATENVVKLTDNYGKSLDKVNNKLMQGTKLLNEQGQVLRLFHNSDNVFDKFDPSKSGSNQGRALGRGNYLAFKQDSHFNDTEYGRYQTQWYANVNKVFDLEKDLLSPEEVRSITEKYGVKLPEYVKEYTSIVVDTIAEMVKVDTSEIWKHLGYDAVKMSDQINVFDPSKIHRANNSVLDIGTTEFDKLKALQKEFVDEMREISKTERQIGKLNNPYIDKDVASLETDMMMNEMVRSPGWKDEMAKIASAYKAKTGVLPKSANVSEETLAEIVDKYELSQQGLPELQNVLAEQKSRLNLLLRHIKEQEVIVNNITQEYLGNQHIPQGVQMTIDDIVPSSAEETATKVEEEAKAIEKAGEAAEKAAESKSKFAGANKEVSDSTGTSIKDLKTEASAFDEVGEAAENFFKTRSGISSKQGIGSDAIDSFNLPVDYLGENGQDAVQMFAKLKSEIEDMTGKPVTIDFVSGLNDDGQLEAVGATLKYVNEEAGITVKQFYRIQRNQDGVLIATQSQERATLAASKAAKAFNTEMQQRLAFEQIKTLEGQMGSLKLDLTEVKEAAHTINDKASLEHFNLALRSAKEQAKQLKTELKGQNTLDTIASMERALLTLPSRLEEMQRRLNALGGVESSEGISNVLRSINEEYQRFLNSTDSEEKVGLFRSLTSSMVWANAEMRNLSGQNAEINRQETAVTKEELAKQKAERESYISWWKTTLNEQSQEESAASARQQKEQAYSDWWNKALFDREQQEKAKDERVIAARKKQEEAYDAWWQKALYNKEKAPNLNYGKTTANASRRKLDAMEGAVDALGVTNPEVLARMEAYRNKVAEIEQLRQKFATNSDAAGDPAIVKQFQKASYEAEQLRKNIKTITDEEQKMMQMSSEQGFAPIELSADQLGNLQNEMVSLARNTAKGRVEIKGWNDDNTQMYYTITNSKGVVKEMTMALGQGTNTLYQYRTATKEMGTLVQQVFKGIKTKAKELVSFVIGGGSVYKIISVLRQGIQYIKEIDLALTELKKVTDETEETYDKFLKTAAKTADKVGSTIKDVVSSTADWARLGYSLEQATKFAESTQILMNVSEFTDVSRATDTLISAVQAFGYTADTSMDVVDLLNTIGNNYAISTADLAQSLTKSSASLVAAGGDLAEAAALTATANKIIQDADSVGTALKTTSLRLRGTDVSVLEAEGLDSDGVVTSKSKLQSKIKALSGVDILTDTGAYKSTYEILSEIADVWEDINDMDQAALLELISGKRNSSVIASILQNPAELKAAYEDAMNASGSAAKENEKYLDSIQGKMDQFSNAVQSLWQNLLGSDVIKGVVEWGTRIVKSLDTVQGKILAIVKAVAILMAYKKVNPLDWITKFANIKKAVDTNGLKNYILSLLQVSAAQKTVTADTLANTIAQEQNDIATQNQIISKLGLTNVTGALTVAQKAQAAQELVTLFNGGKISKDLATRMAAMLGYKFSVDATNTATVALDTTTKSFMATNPVGWILAIVSVLATLVTTVVSLTKNTKKVAEAAKEALSAYENAQETLRSHKKTIEDIGDDYKELAGGVDELGNNVSLTTEEYERYNEIANQIAEMFPDMVSGYTAEGNAIIALKGNVDALTEAYEAEARAARDAILIASSDVFKNFKKNTDKKQTGWSNKSKLEKLEFFEKFATGQGTMDDLTSFRSTMGTAPLDGILEAAGIIDTNWFSSDEDFYNALQNNKAQVQAYYRTLKTEIDTEVSKIKPIVYSYLEQDSGYSTLSSDAKSIISKAINGFTAEFYAQFENNAQMNSWIMTNLVEPLKKAGTSTKFQTIFDLQTSFNKGEVPVNDYLSQLESFKQTLSEIGIEEEIITSISLAFDTEGLDAKQNVAKDFLLDAFDSNVGQLTKSQLDIIDKYADEFEEDMTGVGYTWDDFIAKINEKKLIDAFSPQDFEKVSEGLDSIQSAYNSLSDAIEQYNNTGYLTLDSLQAILSLEPEYLSLLQMENGQLSINQAAAEAMVKAKLAEAEANAIQSAMTQLETLAKEAATKATNDNATAATNAITSLGNYSSALGTVAQDAIIAAGAVSALNNAVDGAKEAGVSEKDINAVMSNLDTYLGLINTTRQNLSTSFVPIVTGGTGGDPEKEEKDTEIQDGWDKLISVYENKLALITNERDLIESEIDRMEAQGGKASAQYYEDLIRNSSEEKALLEDKLAAQKAYLDANADNMDSDTWTEYNNEINETAVAIKECEVNTLEWAEAIREIDTHYFEQITDEISRVGEEIEFVNGLLEDEEVADENGNWSSAALTRIGLYTQQMEQAAAEAKLYQEEIDKLNNQYEDGTLSEEQYQESLSTLVNGQRDAIQSYEDAKDSIVEMNEARVDAIKEGIEKEIEAYEDLIDAKKEELDAERDLHDFRENIKDQTKEISELERRIAGLSGSSAASDIAERRKLEAQLMKAKEGLNDSYYDHSRDAQSTALDEEAEAYALSKEKYIEQLEEQLKEQETLIENSIMDVMLNADTVYNELIGLSDLYGGILSDELTQPWKDASSQAIAWKDELKTSMTSGEYAALIGEGGAVTAFANGVATKLTGSWSKAQTAAQNYAGYLTGTELNSKLSNTLTGFGNQIQKIIDKWNGVKKAADDAYAAQTRQVTVGGTSSASTGSGSSSGSSGGYTAAQKKYYVTASLDMGSRLLAVTKSGSSESEAKSAANIAILGEYEKVKGNSISAETAWQRTWRSKVKYDTKYYAKGTMGTLNDNWSITDEFGDELVMYATPEGTLSYMRKGSTVVPADITSNLVEWGKLNPDMLSLANSTNGINIISNAINKPEINLSFEALVKAERIDENTLPEVKRYVQQEINTLVKQMNYALKGNGAR